MEFKRKMELIDLNIKRELKKKRNKIKRGIGVESKGMYLEGAVCGDGKTEREVCRRVQAGANAWRAVEGVMADLKKTEGHEHLCHTGMPVRDGNLGSDRTTTKKAASV